MNPGTLYRIYKIVNSVDDKIYIGSTKSRLCDRMTGHRYNARDLKNKKINIYSYEKGWYKQF